MLSEASRTEKGEVQNGLTSAVLSGTCGSETRTLCTAQVTWPTGDRGVTGVALGTGGVRCA